jgi:hypothetical protein
MKVRPRLQCIALAALRFRIADWPFAVRSLLDFARR